MHPLRQAPWKFIWKHTVEKSQTNATNVTMHLLRQAIWGDLLKYTVENLPKNATNAEGSLRIHLKTHSREKSNKCIQCNFASSYTRALRAHLKRHSGEKSNRCNQCDFASSEASHLRRHLTTQTKIIAPSVFWIHLRTVIWDTTRVPHSTQMRFRTNIPNNFTSHALEHIGEKHIKCCPCNFMSSLASDLKEHMSLHTGEKPVKCFTCYHCDFKVLFKVS